MNFYKKTFFIFFIIILTFAIFVKLIEPVVDKQISNIFADRNLSKKLSKELVGSIEEFSPEKRIFYKNIIKKLYIKWVPLIDEARKEAATELNK
jgi:uncharacterized FlgJ-related protein